MVSSFPLVSNSARSSCRNCVLYRHNFSSFSSLSPSSLLSISFYKICHHHHYMSCHKSNGSYVIKKVKLVIIQIFSIQKIRQNIWTIFFQALESFFFHKGVFVTKVIKVNIITNIFGPLLSITNTLFKNVSP